MGEVCLENLGLEKVDLFENGRAVYRLPFDERREEIDSLCKQDTCKDIERNDFLSEMWRRDVKAIEIREQCLDGNGFGYNCRQWAFAHAGFPHYSGAMDWKFIDGLMDADLEDVGYSDKPSVGAIVMYTDGESKKHWGLVSEVEGGVRVTSKWGEKEVFNHPIERVSGRYGDYVMFFEGRGE